jgi:ATP-binding cassette subfamily B (MDR/TAP) protein 9
MAFIFKLSWQLSLICFIGAPIVFAVGEMYGKYYKVRLNLLVDSIL